MKKLVLTLLIIPLSALSGLAQAIDELPQQQQEKLQQQPVTLNPVHSVYRASLEKGIPFKGQATRSIEQRKDGSWDFSFNVDSFFAHIRESVHFRWNGYQVIPLHYEYALTGWAVPDRGAVLDFDWKKKQVRNDVKNKPWFMDIHEGVLDRLGFQLQLRQDLKAGKRHMVYDIADGGKLKNYEFAVVGEEDLDTHEHGRVHTIKVDQVRDPGKKRETHLWFAPQWDYLLVRMIQIEGDGTKYEIYLDNARLPNKKID